MSILGFLIVVSLALGAVAWAFFVWTVRSGQYEDPEGAKYRMLEDEEPASNRGATSTAPPGETPTTTGTASSATTENPAASAPSATVNTASFPQPPAAPASALASTAATGAEATSPSLPRVPASRRNGIHK